MWSKSPFKRVQILRTDRALSGHYPNIEKQLRGLWASALPNSPETWRVVQLCVLARLLSPSNLRTFIRLSQSHSRNVVCQILVSGEWAPFSSEKTVMWNRIRLPRQSRILSESLRYQFQLTLEAAEKNLNVFAKKQSWRLMTKTRLLIPGWSRPHSSCNPQ